MEKSYSTPMAFRNIKIAIFLLIVISLSSCQSTIRVLIGAKNTPILTEKKTNKWMKKMKLTNDLNAMLDTSFYHHFIINETISKSDKHKLIQFLQVYHFDDQGNLIEYSNNCQFPGTVISKWENSVKKFQLQNKLLSDSIMGNIKLDDLKAHFIPLNYSEIKQQKTIVAFVNQTLKRKSKSFSKVIKKHFPNHQIIFVNNDNVIYRTFY
jgi:hypothetical protein